MDNHERILALADKHGLCSNCLKHGTLTDNREVVIGHDDNDTVTVAVGDQSLSFASRDFSIFLGLLIRWMV